MNIRGLLDRHLIKKPLRRERLTRIMVRDRDCDIILMDHAIRVNTIKENGYFRASRIAAHSSLLRDEMIVLQHLMLFQKPGMTFIDIGANIGIYSIYMSDLINLYSNFSVEAFEVHPDTFNRLQVNALRCGFVAHHCGIGSLACNQEFVEGVVSHVATLSDRKNSYNVPERTFEMEIKRLDEFSFTGQIFLKIDVEGQEQDVLDGASGLFDKGLIDGVYIDGYPHDSNVLQILNSYDFMFFDARSLKKTIPSFALLALRREAYPDIAQNYSLESIHD